MDITQGQGYIRADKKGPLLAVCWTAYFSANLGRLSYPVAMVEIIRSLGLANARAGLVSTGFFICYGFFQLISGYLGDRVPPGRMIFLGLLGTGLANIGMAASRSAGQMLLIWCLNGVFQSMLWPPIVRIVAEGYAPGERKTAFVRLGTTYPIATFLAYGLGATAVWRMGWRGPFLVFSAIVLLACGMWKICFPQLERCREAIPPPVPEEAPVQPLGAPGGQRLPVLALALFCCALVAQGFLRDGLMNWVPAYLESAYRLSSSAAILSTALLPAVNLLGIYASHRLYRRMGDEAAASSVLFFLSTVSALLLRQLSHLGPAMALIPFALITACMMGVNLMLISFVPAHFARWNRASSVSGMMNAMVYLGSSLATYGIGAAADRLGWGAMLLLLAAVSACGLLFCLSCVKKWRAATQV